MPHDPFDEWLDRQVRDRDGTLDLARLHGTAQRFEVGLGRSLLRLQPDEQRTAIGALPRGRVPARLHEVRDPRPLRPGAGSGGMPGPPSGKAAPPDRPGGPTVDRPIVRSTGAFPSGSGASGGTSGAVPGEATRPGRPHGPTVDGPPTRPTGASPPKARRAMVADASVAELLALYGQVMDELRARKVVRSANAPGGDYAELLFARAFGWRLLGRSAREVDAVAADGTRIQIKSRRLTGASGERQLSALRNLADDPFDHLAGLLFGPDFSVVRAVLVPHSVVAGRARYVAHTNAWTFFLDDAVLGLPGVRDVTAKVAAAARGL